MYYDITVSRYSGFKVVGHSGLRVFVTLVLRPLGFRVFMYSSLRALEFYSSRVLGSQGLEVFKPYGLMAVWC